MGKILDIVYFVIPLFGIFISVKHYKHAERSLLGAYLIVIGFSILAAVGCLALIWLVSVGVGSSFSDFWNWYDPPSKTARLLRGICPVRAGVVVSFMVGWKDMGLGPKE